ncbi:MAG: HD domain-containing protein [Archaeoglobus sp.]|nr:HD domain-containing protein [Archaeoglobus sp.]
MSLESKKLNSTNTRESPYSRLLEKSEKEIAEILTAYLKERVDEEVFRHILVVVDVATKIAERLKLDEESRKLVLAGAMLHDVGRCRSHGMDHAVIGAEMLRKDGFDERIAKIVERHIGAGLTAKEAKSFGLPEKDYIPETIEEKIVALADNLVSNRKVLSKEEYLRAVKEKFSNQPDVLERHIKLLEEFEGVVD